MNQRSRRSVEVKQPSHRGRRPPVGAHVLSTPGHKHRPRSRLHRSETREKPPSSQRSAPPEGIGGGAGRPGSRPLAADLSARGAKNALLGRLRRPPDAWPAWPPCRAGYRRPASPQPAPPCPRSCVEGIPGSFPAKSEVGSPRHRRSAGLAAMPVEVLTATPGSCAEPRPCRSARASSPRWAAYSRTVQRSHVPSAYIMNRDSLSPLLKTKARTFCKTLLCSRWTYSRILVPSPTMQQSPGLLLIGPAPLLEKESSAGVVAHRLNLAHPSCIHRPRRRT